MSFQFTTSKRGDDDYYFKKSESLKKLKDNITTTKFESATDFINKIQNWSQLDLSSLTELTTQIGKTVSQYKETSSTLSNKIYEEYNKQLSKESITIEDLIAEGANLNLSQFIAQYSSQLSNISFNFGSWSKSTTCRIGGTIEDCVNSITYGVLGYVNRWGYIALNTGFGSSLTTNKSINYETLYNSGLSIFRAVNSTISSLYQIYKTYKAIKLVISKTKTIFEFTKDFALTLWSGGTSVPYATATLSEYVAYLVELAIRTVYKIIKSKLLSLKVDVPILIDLAQETIDIATDPTIPITELEVNNTKENSNSDTNTSDTNFIRPSEENKKVLQTFTSELAIKSLIKNFNPTSFIGHNTNIKGYTINSNLNSYQIYQYSKILMDTDLDYSNELTESMLHLSICEDLLNDGIIYDPITHYYNRELTKTNPTSLRKEYKDINEKIINYEKILYAFFGRYYILLNEDIPNLSNMYPNLDGWEYKYDNTQKGKNKYILKNVSVIDNINSALNYLSNHCLEENTYLLDLLYTNNYYQLLISNKSIQGVDINLDISNIENIAEYTIQSNYNKLYDYSGLWFSKFSYPRNITQSDIITTLSNWQYVATDLQKINIDEVVTSVISTFTNQVDIGNRFINSLFNYGRIIKADTTKMVYTTEEEIKEKFNKISEEYTHFLIDETDDSYYYKKNYRDFRETTNNKYFSSYININHSSYKNSKISLSYSNKINILNSKIPFKWGEYNSITKKFYSETLEDTNNNILAYWDSLTKFSYKSKTETQSPFYLAIADNTIDTLDSKIQTNTNNTEYSYSWSKITTNDIEKAKENKIWNISQENFNEEYEKTSIFKVLLLDKKVGSYLIKDSEDFLTSENNVILDLELMSPWELFTTKTNYKNYIITKNISYWHKESGNKGKGYTYIKDDSATLNLKHYHYDYETKPFIYIDDETLTETSNIYIISSYPLNRKESENYNDLSISELLRYSGTNGKDLFNENFIISINSKDNLKQESLYCTLNKFYFIDFNLIFTSSNTQGVGISSQDNINNYAKFITRNGMENTTINNEEIINLKLSYNNEIYKDKYKQAFIYILKLKSSNSSIFKMPMYIDYNNNLKFDIKNIRISNLIENSNIQVINALSKTKNDISINNSSIAYFKNYYLTKSKYIESSNIYVIPATFDYLQRLLISQENINIMELFTKVSSQKIITPSNKEFIINIGARLYYADKNKILDIDYINNITLPLCFTLCSVFIDLTTNSKSLVLNTYGIYSYSKCAINNISSLVYMSDSYFIEKVLEDYAINLKKLKTWNFWNTTEINNINTFFNNINLTSQAEKLYSYLGITNPSNYNDDIPKLVILITLWKIHFDDFIENLKIYSSISTDNNDGIKYNYKTLKEYLSSSLISDCIVLPNIQSENIINIISNNTLSQQDWYNIADFYKNIESNNNQTNLEHILDYLPRPNSSIIIIDSDNNRIEFTTYSDFLDYFWDKSKCSIKTINIKDIYLKTPNNFNIDDIITYTDLIEKDYLSNILDTYNILYTISNNTKTELIEIEKNLKELRNILITEYSNSNEYIEIIYDTTISGESFNNEFIQGIYTLDPTTENIILIEDERLTEYLEYKKQYKEKYVLIHDFNYLLSQKDYLENLIENINQLNSTNIFKSIADKINYIKDNNAKWLNIEIGRDDYDYFLEDCYKINNKEKLNISTLDYIKSYIINELESNEGLYKQRLDVMLLRANSNLGLAYTKIKSLNKINSQKDITLKDTKKELCRKQLDIDIVYDYDKLVYKRELSGEGHFYNYSLIEKIKNKIGDHCLLTCTSCSVKDTCPFYDEEGIIKKYLPEENMLTLYFKDNKLTIIKTLPSELSYLDNMTELHTEDNLDDYKEILNNKDNITEHLDYIINSYIGNISKLISNSNTNSKYISNLITLPFYKDSEGNYNYDLSSSFNYSSGNYTKIKYNNIEYEVETELATEFNLFNQNKDYPVYLVGDYSSQEYNNTYLTIYLGHLSDLEYAINVETQTFKPRTLEEEAQSCIDNDNSFFQATRINNYGILEDNRKQINLNYSLPMIINQNLINEDLVDNNYQVAKPIINFLKGLSLDISKFKWTDKEYANTEEDKKQMSYDIENAKFKLAELTQYGSNLRLVIVKK